MNVQLRPYQRWCIDFIKSRPSAGLFLPMGMGKSLIVLTALYELNPTDPVLVIGPKATIASTWPEELEKWGFPIRMRSLTEDERGKRLSNDARHELINSVADLPPAIYTINRELVPDLVECLPGTWVQPRTSNPDNLPPKSQWSFKPHDFPFKTVIIDESQSFKSYKSRRFKRLAEARPYIHRVIEMSGTPNPQSLEDLFSQLYLLDMGQRLGHNISSFRDRFMMPAGSLVNAQGYPLTWKPLPGGDQMVFDLIKDVVVSLPVLKDIMPPSEVLDVPVKLNRKIHSLLAKLKKELVMSLDGGDVVAANAGVLAAKLQQMASGTVYLEDGSYEVLHKRKLEVLDAIIEYAASPVLVAYYFKSDAEELTKHFADQDLAFEIFDGSPEMKQRWCNRKIDVMAIQPASAGHGLNLQSGGHTFVWYTMTWNSEHYQQANARLVRPGQTESVQIYRLIAEHTIDGRIAEVLAGKKAATDALIDAVKAELDV